MSNSQRTVVETKGWDVFRDPPPKIDSGSMASQRCLDITVQITKAAVYLLVFVIMLCCGVVAKVSVLFMTSQLKAGRTILYCNRQLGKNCTVALYCIVCAYRFLFSVGGYAALYYTMRYAVVLFASSSIGVWNF